MDYVQTTAVASINRIHLQWLVAEFEETRVLMGEDFWTYDVDEYMVSMSIAKR